MWSSKAASLWHAGIKYLLLPIVFTNTIDPLLRHDFLYDINRPIKLNHNLANQNWNKMTGGRRRRPASQGMHAGIIIGYGASV
jgi:hypothetical protein